MSLVEWDYKFARFGNFKSTFLMKMIIKEIKKSRTQYCKY